MYYLAGEMGGNGARDGCVWCMHASMQYKTYADRQRRLIKVLVQKQRVELESEKNE